MSTPPPIQPGVQPATQVWDPFVRMFHWSLVACVLTNYFVIDDGKDVHQWIGYAASALVTLRVVWGFIGTRHARFTDFFPTPNRLRAHFAAMRAGRMEHHIGHNPLGALMMLTLMAVVISLGLTGFLQTTDTFWGEEWLQELHALIASALISLAGLHAAAAILMSRIERTNLVAAMFTGVKRRF
jgi:cytochrome b